jgi:glycosyltransferase involved in cell wall biosynthesis
MMSHKPLANPKISVLMTIYNAGPYLREAIESVVGQTFGEWELIAVENGSTDCSPRVIRGYSDERIRPFFLAKNIGRTAALRYAFEQARGEYIAILDADDIAAPERFAIQTTFLDRHPDIGLVGSWAMQIDKNGATTDRFEPATGREDLHDLLGSSNPFVHSSIMYRSSIAKSVGGYPAEYIYSQDYALILRMEAECGLAMLPQPLCKWRVLSSSMTRSSKYSLIIAQELFSLSRIAGRRTFFKRQALRASHRRQAVLKLKLGLQLFSNKQYCRGLSMACTAIFSDPSCIFVNGVTGRLFGRMR